MFEILFDTLPGLQLLMDGLEADNADRKQNAGLESSPAFSEV
jgi:hypothetical protein